MSPDTLTKGHSSMAHVTYDRPTGRLGSTSAARNENRLSDDDRAAMAQRIAEHLTSLGRPATVSADYNETARQAPRAIGCTLLDLRQSELDEIAEMVCSAILDTRAA